MIQIKRFINKLMSSNCYVVSEDGCRNCIVIDPGSEDCHEIIEYLINQDLEPEYIILTHEHSDHTWGCNALIDKYNSKVVASESCKNALPKESNVYFQFYFDDPDYTYSVKRVDILVEDIDNRIEWSANLVKFIATPGHSDSSICISIENNLFTGDALMQSKPCIPRRGGSLAKYNESIKNILQLYSSQEIVVYPGHGEIFNISEYDI